MFTDEQRYSVWNGIRQRDLRAFAAYLPVELIVEAAAQVGLVMGRGPLHVGNLVYLAVLSAWHTERNFAEVLAGAAQALADLADATADPSARPRRPRRPRRKPGRSKHDPRGIEPMKVSEEAFTQARRRVPTAFWVALLSLLLGRFEAQHGQRLCWKGFRLLALDGTEIPLENRKSLAAHFGTARNGQGRSLPQARLVMLQFPLVRLPYRYELSPLAVGEKTLAGRLIEHLRPGDLVLMDRGFWSYGLFCQIQAREAFFALRGFATAKLTTLRRLGRQDRLVSYAPTDRKWRRQGLPASMTLRAIDYQVQGFRPTTIVTNVLDAELAPRSDWVRLAGRSEPGRHLAAGLYHRRWEIETTFAEVKVGQNLRTALRSRTPEGIAYEIAGHVLGYLLVRWTMVDAAAASGQDPLRLSFTAALHEVQDMRDAFLVASAENADRILRPRLLARIAEHRVPERPGRHYPRPHDGKVKNKGKGKRQLPSKLPSKTPARPKARRHAA